MILARDDRIFLPQKKIHFIILKQKPLFYTLSVTNCIKRFRVVILPNFFSRKIDEFNKIDFQNEIFEYTTSVEEEPHMKPTVNGNKIDASPSSKFLFIDLFLE